MVFKDESVVFYEGHKVYMNGEYPSNIQRIFKGKQKTAKGWMFIKGGD